MPPCLVRRPPAAPFVLWHRYGRQADVSLPLPMAEELGVHARLWLKLDPARGVYCAGYRPAGTFDTRYAGRTPTPADYDAARADPAGAALALVRDMVNGDKSCPPLPGGLAGLPMGA